MKIKEIKKIIKKEIKYRISVMKKKIIINYYKTNFKKNILLSYIDSPFKNKDKINSHSNQREAIIISKVFKELGFNVDIINFEYKGEIKLQKYDVIFGFGDVFEKSFHDKTFKGKRIFYATGAEQDFQINAEIKRVKEFNKKYKVNTLPKRIPSSYWSLSYSFSDAIILIGNDWTKKTWERVYDGLILKQVGSNIFFKNLYNTIQYNTIQYNTIQTNPIEENKKEFIFIGSFGAIHKGLDLCIEVFKELSPKYILNIFAHYEKDFFDVYGKLPENIKFHGFKDINSNEFKEIFKKCSFILAPSCSEGQMTSLILGIGNGLLPLATKETGVDLPEEFIIKSLDLKYLKNKIIEIYNLDEKGYKDKILDLQEKIQKNHNLKAFEKCFRKNIMTINNKIF